MIHDPNRKPEVEGVKWQIVIPIAIGLWAVILTIFALTRDG